MLKHVGKREVLDTSVHVARSITITEEIEQWIGCDECDSWYHCECVGVDPDSIPDSFVCARCSDR